MKSFNVSEIQYLNRDYCQLFSKPLVYLHYMDHADKYPNAAYQYVLKKEPFDDQTTNESIIDGFCDYIQSQVNVSKRCRILTFIKSFQLEYPGILDGVDVYPDYKVSVVDISNKTDSLPDLGFVWELNRIAPAFCGMFFENIISQCLGLDDKPFDLSEVMFDNESNITDSMICGLIERNFISKKYVRGSNHVQMNKKRTIMIGDELLNEKHFISNAHYLVYLSLRHFMKRNLKGSDVENALNVLEYVNNNITLFDEYVSAMATTTLIRNMSKQTNLRHGEIMRTENLSGEVDFISNQSIIDIKCYKEDEPDNWFGQLWLYQQLFGKHSNLWIVNVYNNKLYKFEEVKKK